VLYRFKHSGRAATPVLFLHSMPAHATIGVPVAGGAGRAVALGTVLFIIVKFSASVTGSSVLAISFSLLHVCATSGTLTLSASHVVCTSEVGSALFVVHPAGSLLLLFFATLVASAFFPHLLLNAMWFPLQLRHFSCQKMRNEIHAENEGVVIPVQVRWLPNRHSNTDRRQCREISALSVVFVVKGGMVAWILIKGAIEAAGVWYPVEPITNACPESRYEHWCRWSNLETKCSGKPACSYNSGLHRTGTHKCSVVGCSANQGSLSGHSEALSVFAYVPHKWYCMYYERFPGFIFLNVDDSLVDSMCCIDNDITVRQCHCCS